LFNAPNVFFFSFALPCKDGNTGSGNGGSGVILGRENIAGRPSNLGTEGN